MEQLSQLMQKKVQRHFWFHVFFAVVEKWNINSQSKILMNCTTKEIMFFS